MSPNRLTQLLGRLGRSLAITIALFTTAAAARAAVVDVSFATDKPIYEQGETIHMLITAYNPAASALTLHFPTTTQAQYQIDGGIWHPSVPSFAETSVTISGGGSKTWDLPYRLNPPLAPGEHTALARVVGQGEAGPVTFTIVPEPAGAAVLLVFCAAAITRRRRG